MLYLFARYYYQYTYVLFDENKFIFRYMIGITFLYLVCDIMFIDIYHLTSVNAMKIMVNI